jgi:hypothetical protein
VLLRLEELLILEGSFQLDNNKNVKDLINSAKGFSNDKLGLMQFYTEIVMDLTTNLFQ